MPVRLFHNLIKYRTEQELEYYIVSGTAELNYNIGDAYDYDDSESDVVITINTNNQNE